MWRNAYPTDVPRIALWIQEILEIVLKAVIVSRKR